MGSFLAAGLYHLLEVFHWKEANPGQDYDEEAPPYINASEKTPHPDSDTSEEPPTSPTTPT